MAWCGVVWCGVIQDEADQVARERKENNKKLREIDNAMHKALKGNRSQIGRYCIDMLQSKQEESRRKHMKNANGKYGLRK